MALPKLLILDVAALGYDLLNAHGITQLAGLPTRPLTTVAPAVTCTVQATLRTARSPVQHQMPSNGFYDRTLRQSFFWHQSSELVKGPRIWETFREKGGRIGLYFFQQSLGESVDEIISPAPIHPHGGGLIMATYSQPSTLLNGNNPVPLWRYWGPLASPKVGRPIIRFLCERLQQPHSPEVIMAYLPTLDYDLQRYGTHHRKTSASVQEVVAQIETLIPIARTKSYEIVIIGDYAITDVTHAPCFPNRELLNAGLFSVRAIQGMLYPDFHQSRAFALCDHQTALIYCKTPAERSTVRNCLANLSEIDTIEEDFAGADFHLTAKAGTWFAYPWWQHPSEAPDYATHVDIHNKPGFDPCELFFGRTPFQSSTDATRIRGTHGRNDAPVALATTLNIEAPTLQLIAESIRTWLS